MSLVSLISTRSDLSWVSRAQGIWQNDALLLFGAKSYFSNSKRYGDQLAIVAQLPNGVAWAYPSIYADPKSIPAVALPFSKPLTPPPSPLIYPSPSFPVGIAVWYHRVCVSRCFRAEPHYECCSVLSAAALRLRNGFCT
jgi:hypothetical protein